MTRPDYQTKIADESILKWIDNSFKKQTIFFQGLIQLKICPNIQQFSLFNSQYSHILGVLHQSWLVIFVYIFIRKHLQTLFNIFAKFFDMLQNKLETESEFFAIFCTVNLKRRAGFEYDSFIDELSLIDD